MVVANPVVTGPADVTIPAVQLSSGNGVPVDMLDRAFLDAIAPAPPESTNPLEILKELLHALATDAAHVGRDAIAQAFVAGAAAFYQPSLTAASLPYVAAPEPASLPVANPTYILVAPSSPEAVAALAPRLSTVLSQLFEDVGYVGDKVAEAAFAVGAMLASEPALVGRTLATLVTGDVRAALADAVKAVAALLEPSSIVVDALREVAGQRLAESHGLVASMVPQAQAKVAEAVAPEPAADPSQSVTRTSAQQLPRQDRPSARRSAAPGSTPVRRFGAPAEMSELPTGATDLTSGNKVAPRLHIRTPGEVGGQVDGVIDQPHTSVGRFGDAVRDAVKPPAGKAGTVATGASSE